MRRRASGRSHYNYARDYDPGTGRYIQSDPIGLRAGVNTYAYVNNGPVSKFDFSGLSAADVQLIYQFSKAWTNEQTAQGWRIEGWRNDACYWERRLGISDSHCNPNHDYNGCRQQSKELINALNAAIANGDLKLDDTWKFFIETNLSDTHFWVDAASSSEADPFLRLDPWSNQFGTRF